MTTYTVQSGDTLGAIAKKLLGNSGLYMKIAEANNMADPNKLSVGMELVIPELPQPSTQQATQTDNHAQAAGEGFELKAQQLHEMLDTNDTALIDKYLDAVNACFARYQINSPLRVCHFLAQVAHESGNFKQVVENLNYGAPALKVYFGKYFDDDAHIEQYARQPEKIAGRVYANRMGNGDETSGEGWQYRGRGLIQLTGKENYQNYSNACNVDLVSNPDGLAEDPMHCVGAAGWYWDSKGLNQYADEDDVKTITRRINGGLNGLDDRLAKLEKAKAIFGL